jgi:hypothetical protein
MDIGSNLDILVDQLKVSYGPADPHRLTSGGVPS